MSAIELNVPVRLYWDLSPLPPDAPLDYAAISRDIIGLRILSVNLLDLTQGLSGACLSVLESLKGKGPAVSLTVAPQSVSSRLLDRVRDLGVRTVLVRVDEPGQLAALPDGRESGPAVGISFDVTAANWRKLPEVVSYCSRNGIGSLSLPMQRLTEKGGAFYLAPHEKRELEMLLKPVLPAAPKLTIHDPFLWKIFFPDVIFPDGGCQAGNTMLYISSMGLVYPCPTLPIEVGRLSSLSFREIALSEAKKHVRREILSLPAACFDCAEAAVCKGGCRGRAFVARDRLDSADPGCLS